MVIASAPTKQIVKQLKAAGFTSRPGKGSHSTWICAHGSCKVSLPDGHRTISPGVRRQVDAALAACEDNCTQKGSTK